MFSISLLTLSTIHIFKGLIKKMRYIYLIYLINYFCHFPIKVSFFFPFCFVNPTIFHFFNLQHHGKAYFKMSNESTESPVQKKKEVDLLAQFGKTSSKENLLLLASFLPLVNI